MLTITANTLSQIKKQFNDQFPFLKLEFFRQKSNQFNSYSQAIYLEDDYLTRSSLKNNVSLFINEHMPISSVEKMFLQQFGINTQVLRKSGNTWLETSLTHDWTLKRQNDEGKELSSLLFIKKHQR